MSVTPFRAKKPKEPDDPHISGNAKCMVCKGEWVAVAPIGSCAEMECPHCGMMRGVWRYPILGWDVPTWTCLRCENNVFVVLAGGIGCIGCGNNWTFEEIAGDPSAA